MMVLYIYWPAPPIIVTLCREHILTVVGFREQTMAFSRASPTQQQLSILFNYLAVVIRYSGGSREMPRMHLNCAAKSGSMKSILLPGRSAEHIESRHALHRPDGQRIHTLQGITSSPGLGSKARKPFQLRMPGMAGHHTTRRRRARGCAHSAATPATAQSGAFYFG